MLYILLIFFSICQGSNQCNRLNEEECDASEYGPTGQTKRKILRVFLRSTVLKLHRTTHLLVTNIVFFPCFLSLSLERF